MARYDYDLKTGKLLFSEGSIVKVVAEIQIAGSTSVKASNWLGRGQIQTCLANSLATQNWFDPSEKKTALTSWLRRM
ncbi:hypothetical protein MESS2_450071 [Mesorhizobium metallidurans STM 2683]|uniref:Uncharacterized protein n=1 Tax=Mesorhizobium metallidurans STM 2683 TaxID=1297569 RepID=M5ERX3_9HYPH|nr:hypothetical protein [Mesorhizobium metallidurans]CCV07057.1 hypothetical protein MESS2_450071 [Mesorhizobium metallidurans STM 2683]